MKRSILCAAVLAAALAGGGSAAARDQIRIVGSSTVYPFATAVAEEFGRASGFKTPIIESTGTGGGFKLFCGGVGVGHPDITNASRRIKQSEVDLCAANGVTSITEVKIGYDGIVLAHSKQGADMALTRRELYLALAKEIPARNGKLIANPNKTWKDVDPKFPDQKIEVLGPPPTSGTRDAFNELAIEAGCKTFPELAALEASDNARFKKPVSPGDQIILKVKIDRILRGIWKYSGQALVDGNVVAEAEMMCILKAIEEK